MVQRLVRPAHPHHHHQTPTIATVEALHGIHSSRNIAPPASRACLPHRECGTYSLPSERTSQGHSTMATKKNNPQQSKDIVHLQSRQSTLREKPVLKTRKEPRAASASADPQTGSLPRRPNPLLSIRSARNSLMNCPDYRAACCTAGPQSTRNSLCRCRKMGAPDRSSPSLIAMFLIRATPHGTRYCPQSIEHRVRDNTAAACGRNRALQLLYQYSSSEKMAFTRSASAAVVYPGPGVSCRTSPTALELQTPRTLSKQRTQTPAPCVSPFGKEIITRVRVPRERRKSDGITDNKA